MKENEAKIALRRWVVGRGNVTEDKLDDDSGLVSDGLINSLDIFELIAHMESLNGRPLETSALKGDEFRSINSLVAAFFKETA